MATPDNTPQTPPPLPAPPPPPVGTQGAAPAPADLLAMLGPIAQQLLPQPVTVDTTPVKGGRSWTSLLGEGLSGGPPQVPMSPQAREEAGNRGLMNFGIGLMAASHYQPGQTIFSNLAQGFQGAQRSQLESEQLAAQTLGAQQAYAQQQGTNKIEALKAAIPLLNLEFEQRRLAAIGGMPSPLATPGAPATPVAGTPGVTLPVIPRNPSAPTAGQQGYNPGNIMAPAGANIPGAVGAIPVQGGYVAAFPDAKTGVAATADLLSHFASTGITTVRDAVKTWVGHDPPPGYAEGIAKALGVGLGDTVDLSNPSVQRAFILAQQPHESGRAWLQPADVDAGLALAAQRRTAGPAAAPAGAPAPANTRPPPVPGTITAPATGGGGLAAAGGTQFAGPGARAGATAPLPAQVPGDVAAIMAGRQAAATGAPLPAAPTAVAGPGAPPGPPAPPPPAPFVPTGKGPLEVGSREEYIREHPFVPSPEQAQIFSPDLPPAAQTRMDAQLHAAQVTVENTRRMMELGGATQADVNKAVDDYNKIQSQNTTAILERQKAAHDAYTTAQQNWVTSLESSYDKAHELDQTGKNRAQEIQQQLSADLVKSRQAAAMKSGDDQLGTMNTQAQKAHDLNDQLMQIVPLIPKLATGGVGLFLADHPQLAGIARAGGLVSPETADATSLVNSLVRYMGTELKPTGTGALREYEFNALVDASLNMSNTPQGMMESLGRMLNLNDRVMQEADWTRRYYNRQVPDDQNPGKTRPAFDLNGGNFWGDMNAPVSAGGLGPVIPHYTGAPGDTAALKRYRATQPPGRPYYNIGGVGDPNHPDPNDPQHYLRNPDGSVVTQEYGPVFAPFPGLPAMPPRQ